MSMIETKGVTYYYSKSHPVLDGIDLRLDRGMMYVIFGPSGCGKTTLLSLLGGLDVPKAGHILFDGRDVQEIGLERLRREKVAFVFQNYNLIDYMTPVENVLLTAKEAPMPVLGKLGLQEEEAKRNVLKLSGGEQQRVAIARALVNSPAVLLADEPSGNLDSHNRDEIHRLFFELRDRLGQTVVIVTHDEHLAAMADRKITMSDGRIL